MGKARKPATRKELRKQDKLEKKTKRQTHEANRQRKSPETLSKQQTTRFQFDEDEAPAVAAVPVQKKKLDTSAKAADKFLTKKTKLEQELEEDEQEIRMLEEKLGIRKKVDWDRAAKEFRKDGFDDEMTSFLRGDVDNEYNDHAQEESESSADDDEEEEQQASAEEEDDKEEEDDEDSNDEDDDGEEVRDPLANSETTFLPKSGLYGEDAAPLVRNNKSKMRSQDDEEVIHGEMRSILNKLSPENASQCLKQLVSVFDQYSFQECTQALYQTLFSNSDEDVLLASALVIVLDAMQKGRNILSTFVERLVVQQWGLDVSASFLGNLCALDALAPELCWDVFYSNEITERGAVQLLHACGGKIRALDPVRFRDYALLLGERLDSNIIELHARNKHDYKPREDAVRQRKKWMMREVFQRYEHSRLPPPLQVSLEDFLQAETKGRWWIQGASWQQQQEQGSLLLKSSSKPQLGEDALDHMLKQHAALVPNAIKFGLKTKLKQAVFCAVMSGSDYLDAFTRIQQLKLAALEERVLCQVLVNLASETKTYNPFFALVCVQLCTYNSRFKFSFQVVIWDRLKGLNPNKSCVNFAKFTAELVFRFALSLTLLKNVDLVRIASKEMVEFLREFFVHLFTGLGEGRDGDLLVAKAFSRLQHVQEGNKLRDGMVVFFSRTEPFLNAKRTTLLGKRVTIAKRVLEHYVKEDNGMRSDLVE